MAATLSECRVAPLESFNDGKRIAGRNASGEAVVFDRATQKAQVIPGIEPQEMFNKWTEDGQALLMSSGTRWAARMYRVEMATGKRTLLQTVELSEKAGVTGKLRLEYAEHSKTYVFYTGRSLGTLYGPEGYSQILPLSIACTRPVDW